tara:strand:+ start:2290 stop:3492 length:1203 start_codon:yes stop_codon:yes gene_type:complete
MNKVKVGILGLGYVGLPIFLSLKNNFETIGCDIDQNRIFDLKKGYDKNFEFTKKKLNTNKESYYTNNIEDLKKCNFFIVTVPTPVSLNKEPDFKPLFLACSILKKVTSNNDIVFFESTVYPGTTKFLKKKFFNKKKLIFGYSPERINPGDKINTLKKIHKIVSFDGKDNEVKKKILSVYKYISNNLVVSNSIENAEMSKVIENIQRDINIAFMNEILMVCEKLNLNFSEVLKLAKTKWNFLDFSPGLVGGHCLPVDPYYLYSLAKKRGHDAKFMLAGRKVNDFLVKFLEKKIVEKIKKIKNKKVLICGLTYKANVSDTRNSLALRIFKNISLKKNINIEAYDPIINIKNSRNEKINNKIKNLSKYGLIIILVNHSKYSNQLKKYKIKNEKKYYDPFFLIS